MNKFLDKIQERLGPVAYKLDSNRYLSAIKNGFFAAMPLLIIGSLFLLITQLPFEPYLNLMRALLGENWMSYFLKVNDMAMNIMTIYVILGIAKELAKYYRVDDMSSQVGALFAFLIITP